MCALSEYLRDPRPQLKSAAVETPSAVLQADREERAEEFAEMYNESTLKQANDLLLSGGVGGPKKTRVSMMTSLELSVKQETTTPFWFALKTLVKVLLPLRLVFMHLVILVNKTPGTPYAP